jgi:hypothetical protein
VQEMLLEMLWLQRSGRLQDVPREVAIGRASYRPKSHYVAEYGLLEEGALLQNPFDDQCGYTAYSLDCLRSRLCERQKRSDHCVFTSDRLQFGRENLCRASCT